VSRGMNETRALARFVAQTKFTDLPRSLVDNLKLTVLDTIGAAFVGSLQPWARRIVTVTQGLGGALEASVVGQSWRTDVARAAFANGVLIGAFECEPLTGSHASGTVLPAALAVCERERLRGAAGLTALADGDRRVAAAGAVRVRARAARRVGVSHRAGRRLRGLRAHRAHGRGAGDGTRLSPPRHAGAVRRGGRRRRAVRRT